MWSLGYLQVPENQEHVQNNSSLKEKETVEGDAKKINPALSAFESCDHSSIYSPTNSECMTTSVVEGNFFSRSLTDSILSDNETKNPKETSLLTKQNEIDDDFVYIESNTNLNETSEKFSHLKPGL